jgi:hypothetical protein
MQVPDGQWRTQGAGDAGLQIPPNPQKPKFNKQIL